jgi:hypothetical protein
MPLRKKKITSKNLRCPGCGHSVEYDHASSGCVHVDDEGSYTCNCKLSAREVKEFRLWQKKRR